MPAVSYTDFFKEQITPLTVNDLQALDGILLPIDS